MFVCDFAWLSDYDGKEKNNYGPSLCRLQRLVQSTVVYR